MMTDWIKQLLEMAGVHLDEPSLAGLMALLGLLCVALGAAIALFAAFGAWSRSLDDGASRLLPTLAEDALDTDLKEIYEQSLYLDTLLAQRLGSDCPPTGARLSRRVRKYLVRVQARRFAARAGTSDHDEGTRARPARFDDLLDRAIALVEACPPADDLEAPSADRLLAELNDLGDAIPVEPKENPPAR